jgi:NAD(P)-dependent dehydrogenase (short-subunit alcohol dehydrogenase family)
MTRTNANTGNWDNAALMQEILDHQALARHGEADDQARAVRYFAGPESGWVTGQVLIVDGGHTLRGFIDNAKLFPLPDQGDPANFT